MSKQSLSDQKNQKQKFIAAARKAECDESEGSFDGKLRKIAKAASKPNQKAVKAK